MLVDYSPSIPEIPRPPVPDVPVDHPAADAFFAAIRARLGRKQTPTISHKSHLTPTTQNPLTNSRSKHSAAHSLLTRAGAPTAPP
jgi:hypothetical protein